MKQTLPFLVPAVLLAVIAGGYLMLSRPPAPTTRAPGGGVVRGSVEEREPANVLPTPREDRRAETKRTAPLSGTKASELIDRLVASRHPAEFGPLADELSRADLSPEDLERLRALARGQDSAHLRRIALQILAARTDADGKNLEALKAATSASEDIVSHTAYSALREYMRVNPSNAGPVNTFLLDRARASAEEETRTLAASSVDYDALLDADRGAFRTLLSDGSEEVRCAALYSVNSSSRRAEALKVLGDVFSTDPSMRVKRHVIALLAEKGSKDELATLKGRSSELDAEIDELLKDLESR